MVVGVGSETQGQEEGQRKGSKKEDLKYSNAFQQF